MIEPKFSGPGKSGICKCGCPWQSHHIMLVMKQEYIDETGEGCVPGGCTNYGNNEYEGMKYNEETEEWEDHCMGYEDRGL